MKKTNFLLFALLCTSIFILNGCSMFDSSSSKPNTVDFNSDNDMMEISGSKLQNNNLPEISNDSEELPNRPTKEWTPVKGVKSPTIYFAYDQSRIGTSQIPKLESVANYLKNHKDLGLIIEGHCDEKGSAEYNIGLGERRALSAREYLEKLGVSTSKMQTISYGSEKPSNNGHDDKAWIKNRRAELILAKM